MEENEKYMDSLIRFVNQAPLDSNAGIDLDLEPDLFLSRYLQEVPFDIFGPRKPSSI